MINNILPWMMVVALCTFGSLSYGDAGSDPIRGHDAKSQRPLLLAGKLGDFLENLKKSVEEANQKKSSPDSSAKTSQPISGTEQTSPSSVTLSREENREIQQRLLNLGYNPGPADGLPGQKTQIAIKKYQEDNKLPDDGIPSQQLLSHLRGVSNSSSLGTMANNNKTSSHSVNATTYKTSNTESSKNSSGAGTSASPFGIPIGEKFDPKNFGSYQERDTALTYNVMPKNTHPSFKNYVVTTDYSGLVYQVWAYSDKLSIEYESVSDCVATGAAIADAIKSKYRPVKKTRDSKSTRSIILTFDTSDLTTNFGWLCDPDGRLRKGSITYVHRQLQKSHTNAVAKKQEMLQRSKEAEKREQMKQQGGDVF